MPEADAELFRADVLFFLINFDFLFLLKIWEKII